jgi:hypothetical protein
MLSKERNRTEKAVVIFSAQHCPIGVAKIPKWCNPTEIVVLVMPQQHSTQKPAYLYRQITADQGTQINVYSFSHSAAENVS